MFDSKSLALPGGARSLNGGSVRSLGGSAAGWAAAAFANGTMGIIDATGSTPALSGEIVFSSSGVQVAGDGTFMIAMASGDDAQFIDDRSFKQFLLPSGENVRTWPYQYPDKPLPISFVLPASANVWGRVFSIQSPGVISTWRREVIDVQTDAVVWSDTITHNGAPSIRISRDGTRIAVSDGNPDVGVSTQLFVNGALTSAVEGWAVGWADDTKLLVNRYVSIGYGGFTFDHTELVDAQGNVTASSYPNLSSISPISASEAYASGVNAIYDSATGTRLWSGSRASNGGRGVAGDFVVYATGHELVAESWR